MPKTLECILKATRRLATEHPAALYSPPNGPGRGCSNVAGSVTENDALIGTGCIIGQAAVLCGFTIPVGAESDGSSTLLSLFGLRPTGEQEDWLDQVQTRQDSGSTWGEALKAADEAFPLG